MSLSTVQLSAFLSQAAVGECVACALVHPIGEYHGGTLESVARFHPEYVAARLAGDEPAEYCPPGWGGEDVDPSPEQAKRVKRFGKLYVKDDARRRCYGLRPVA